MLGFTGFEPGERVRVKHRNKICLPTGYPLDGAEGTVLAAIYPWQLAYVDYDGYIPVRIDKSPTPLGIGSELMFKAEELEKLDS